jgi:hypothetical protein
LARQTTYTDKESQNGKTTPRIKKIKIEEAIQEHRVKNTQNQPTPP